MTQDTLVLTGILGAGMAVAGTVAGYFILRRLKGKVTVHVVNRAYQPGETVAGQVQLQCRKPVQCNRFYVALICQEVVRERRGNKTVTRRNELLRREQDLGSAGYLRAGTRETYEFALPASAPAAGVGASTTGNQVLDTVIGAAQMFQSHRRIRLEWFVEARVDAQGIDLVNRQRISVNS